MEGDEVIAGGAGIGQAAAADSPAARTADLPPGSCAVIRAGRGRGPMRARRAAFFWDGPARVRAGAPMPVDYSPAVNATVQGENLGSENFLARMVDSVMMDIDSFNCEPEYKVKRALRRTDACGGRGEAD
ncbi:MAG: hypothetical protein ACREQI_11775 [Candidatus Binataceae bacterium]